MSRDASRRLWRLCLGLLVLATLIGIWIAARPAPEPRPAASSEAESAPEAPFVPPQGDPAEWTAEAIQIADALAAAFPRQVEALDAAARFHQGFAAPEKAAAYWERCVALAPDSAEILYCLGSAAWDRGDHEQAVVWLQRAMAAPGAPPDAAVVLAESLMQLGKPDEAADALEKAEKAGPPAMRWFLLGQARLQMKQYEKARAAYESALAAEPDFTKAHYGLTIVWNRLGDAGKAEAHKARFLQLNAAENARYEGGRPGARDRSADELRHGVAALAHRAARLYAQHGDRAEALRLLARAAALAPENPAYRQARQALAKERPAP